jgi:recombination protein RecA
MTQKKEENINKEESKLDNLKKTINKAHGKNSVFNMGSDNKVDIKVIPTGFSGIDNDLLGIGGFPCGRMVEIYGPESSGKTTLALHAIAEAQRSGGVALLIDAEYALDVNYAKNLGVDVDNLLISQPDTMEDALEILDTAVRSCDASIIVLDSVAALSPEAEINGEMGDSHMGLHARLMSQATRKLKGIISKSNTCVIFLNQIRMKIGVVFGNPETVPGGQALKFYSSIRIDIRRSTAIKSGDNIVGNNVKIKCVKNKLAPPFKAIEMEINYGTGFNKYTDKFNSMVKSGEITKSGSWYYCNGERIAQGKEKTIEWLAEKNNINTVNIDNEMAEK